MSSSWHRGVPKSHFQVIKSVPLWANQSDLLLICVWWPSAFIWNFSSVLEQRRVAVGQPQEGSRALWLLQHWLGMAFGQVQLLTVLQFNCVPAPSGQDTVWAILRGSRGVRREGAGFRVTHIGAHHLPSSLTGGPGAYRAVWEKLGMLQQASTWAPRLQTSPPDTESWLCSFGPLMLLLFEPKIISEII